MMAFSTEIMNLIPAEDKLKMEEICTNWKVTMIKQMDAFYAGREYIYSLEITKDKFFIIYSGCRHLVCKIGDLTKLYKKLALIPSYKQEEAIVKIAKRSSKFDTKITSDSNSEGFSLGNSTTTNSQTSLTQTAARAGNSDSNSYNPVNRDEWLAPIVDNIERLPSKELDTSSIDKWLQSNFIIEAKKTPKIISTPTVPKVKVEVEGEVEEADKVPYISNFAINANQDRSQAVGDSEYSNTSISGDKSHNTSTEGATRSGNDDYTKLSTNYSDAQLIMKMISQKIPNIREQFWASFEPLFSRLI